MIKPIHKMSFQHPIIRIKFLDDGNILVIDSQTTVAILDAKDYGLVSGFKAKVPQKEYRHQVVDFSSDRKQLAFVTADAKESKLFSLKLKKIYGKVSRHQGHVSCVAIDPKNRYMFSCGEDGKIFVLDVRSGKLAFVLPLHIDTITDIAFSDDARYLVTTSYDKKVILFDIDNMTSVGKLIGHPSASMVCNFLTHNRVFSADNKCGGIIWDTKKLKVFKRLEGLHDNVVKSVKSQDNRFLFVATELGYVIVYELENYEMLSAQYIKLSNRITAMAFDTNKNHLLIATKNNEIFFYDIYQGEKELQKEVVKKRYEALHLMSKENPLLRYTKIAQKVEDLWEATYKKARLHLERCQMDEAKKVFKPFEGIPSKNTIIKKTLSDFAEFGKFLTYIKQRKFSLAYSMVLKYPIYKESAAYEMLEKGWKKAFTLAQKYSLDPKMQDKAHEILTPYKGVAEKTKMIKELFLQRDVYRRFKIAIGQKDFKFAFELIRQHPFLKELSEYDALLRYGDDLYIKSQKFLQVDDTHSAIKLLRILVDFDDFKDEATKLLDDIELRQKFFAAINDGDMGSAYECMSKSEELQYTDEGMELQERWNNEVMKANTCAVNGDIEGIKEMLGGYMSLHSKYVALARVFGWAYMVQLEHAIKKREEQSKIEQGIKNYILSFGIQDQIENLYAVFKRYYPRTKLNLDKLPKGSLEMWRPSMIVESILDA